MKKVAISVLSVLAFLSVNTILSTTYADTKITIFKVSQLSKKQKLNLRAYPSPKSRVKVSLPYNAKDLTETGKQKKVGRTLWRQVNWNNEQGWVNANYLKKTGVLLRKGDTAKAAASSSSRNIINRAKVISTPDIIPEDKPQSFGGDRYDQPVKMTASDVKVAFSEDGSQEQTIFRCEGDKPKQWNITMDTSKNSMVLKMPDRSSFTMPINYHEWESPSKVRMSLGGDKGRNMVDVNLEKTNNCKNDNTSRVFSYEVNATINKNFYFGCCDTVK